MISTETASSALAEPAVRKQGGSVRRAGGTGPRLSGVSPAATSTGAVLTDPFCAVHPLARVLIASGLATPEIVRRLRAFELAAGLS